MASKARKELRSRTKEEVDMASSGELSMETLGNTIKAMYRGGKAESQLDKEEGLKMAGTGLMGALVGKTVSDIQGVLSKDAEQISASGYSISDDELLSKLKQSKMNAGISGPDVQVGCDMDLEMGD
jgi:hypothetical protein